MSPLPPTVCQGMKQLMEARCEAICHDGRLCGREGQLELVGSVLCEAHAPLRLKRRGLRGRQYEQLPAFLGNACKGPRSRTARRLAAAIAAGVGAVALVAASALAQTGENCLGNSGARTVPPGASYTDHSGRWECRPDDPSASAGGWVLVEAVPVATPVGSITPVTMTPTVTPSRTPATTPLSGVVPAGGSDERPGETQLFNIVVAVMISIVTVLFVTFVAWRRQMFGPRLSGWLELDKEE